MEKAFSEPGTAVRGVPSKLMLVTVTSPTTEIVAAPVSPEPHGFTMLSWVTAPSAVFGYSSGPPLDSSKCKWVSSSPAA